MRKLETLSRSATKVVVMSKFLCIFAAVISAILFLLFLLDLIAGIPFNKANALLDVVFIVCAGGIVALSALCFLKQK